MKKILWIWVGLCVMSGCGGPRAINLDGADFAAQNAMQESIRVPFKVEKLPRIVAPETDVAFAEGACPSDRDTIRVYLDSLDGLWASGNCVKNRFQVELETTYVSIGTHVVFFVLEREKLS